MDWKRVGALMVVGIGLFSGKAEALTPGTATSATLAPPTLQNIYWAWQGGVRVWVPGPYYPPYYAPPAYYAPPPPPPYAYGALPYYYGGRYYAHRGWYGGGWRYW